MNTLDVILVEGTEHIPVSRGSPYPNNNTRHQRSTPSTKLNCKGDRTLALRELVKAPLSEN